MNIKDLSVKQKWLILAAAGILLIAGVLIGVLPLLQKNQALKHQEILLQSIEKRDGALVVTELTSDEVDFYDGDDLAEYDYADGEESRDDEPGALNGIGVLEIERIALRLPVVDGVRKSDLKIALGHAPFTPTIGEMGNAVIAGHRSYTYGQFFNRLDEVRMGDIIRFTDMQGASMDFTVYEIQIIEPNDLSVFDAAEYPSITLLTCTPVRKATHRLIVRAAFMEDIWAS